MSYLKEKELRQHLEWLESNKIIELTAEGFAFTLYGREICNQLGYYNPPNGLVLVAGSNLALAKFKEVDWQNLFVKLIMDAKVPKHCEDTRGGIYNTNKYSVPGMKAFKKALEGGVDYDVLVKSTMLYYKSNVKLKKAIGNYFAQGDFLSDYASLQAAHQSGTLTEHIKSETNDKQQSAWKLG